AKRAPMAPGQEQQAQATRDALLKACRSTEHDRVIISGEGMSSLSGDDLEGLKSFLREAGAEQIKVLAWVRAPRSFMESQLQQHLKRDVTYEFPWPNYRRRFEKFERVFGRENTTLLNFDPPSFADRCAVTEFCARVDVARPAEVVRNNESLSHDGAALMFVYHHVRRTILGRANAVGEGATGFAVRRLTAGLEGPRLRLSAQVARAIWQAHAGDVAWVAERLDKPFDESPESYRDEHAAAISDVSDLLRLSETALAHLRKLGLPEPASSSGTATYVAYGVAIQNWLQQRAASGAPAVARVPRVAGKRAAVALPRVRTCGRARTPEAIA
ncbi:MAG TPA: hypothetical protein VLA16_16175, partial [Ideonella sp.]|nr:hypothetical protein [Ideonella sp.]